MHIYVQDKPCEIVPVIPADKECVHRYEPDIPIFPREAEHQAPLVVIRDSNILPVLSAGVAPEVHSTVFRAIV